MKKFKKLLAGAAVMLLSTNLHAGDFQVGNAWARATAPGQDSAMVDLTLTAKQAATLVSVASPAARVVELHSMIHENNMMKMREVKTLALPAGEPFNFGKRGYHVMLIGLTAPLKAGESVPLMLDIKVGDRTVKVEAKAAVRPLAEPVSHTHEHSNH